MTTIKELSRITVDKHGSRIKDSEAVQDLGQTPQIYQVQNEVFGCSEVNSEDVELQWDQNLKDVNDVPEQLQTSKEDSTKFDGGTRDPDLLLNWYFFDLQFLHLDNLNCWCLPPLGLLTALKVLVIEGLNQVQTVGLEFYGMNYASVRPFPSLVCLIFQGMLQWQEWISPEVEGGVFPCLQELSIRKCPKLKSSLPKCLLPSTKVEMLECPELLARLAVIDNLSLLDSKIEQLKDDDEEVALQCSELSTEDSNIYHVHKGTQMLLHIIETPSGKSVTDDPVNRQKPQGSLEDTSSYESLKVSEVSQLIKLPPQLHSLKIEGCDTKYLPDALMDNNSHLQNLYIINCYHLKSFQGGHRPNGLKTLYIRNSRKLEIFSSAETGSKYPNLEQLCIGSSCNSLMDFPLSFFPKLRSLVLSDCTNLESISVTQQHTALNTLEISDCPKLISFPEGGLSSPKLKSMLLSNCKNLKVLPTQLHKLTYLQSLFIKDCPELESIPEGGFPEKLILLCITSCNKLTPSIEWGLHKLDNLSHFEIEGGCRDLESFPMQELLPGNLNSLRISRLPTLKLLNYKGIRHLSSLATLEINCCNKLQSLPEEGLPSSLTFLHINDCVLLKSKLQKKKGKDWYKIAHIPHIQIDDEVMS